MKNLGLYRKRKYLVECRFENLKEMLIRMFVSGDLKISEDKHQEMLVVSNSNLYSQFAAAASYQLLSRREKSVQSESH